MLRLAALGLFQKEPLNGYRLKQQLEVFMGCCICANYGAIYPLLKRMEAQGEIELEQDEPADAGQHGKVYRITALGRERWKEEMMTHHQESWVNARSRFLIKVFFFSHLEPAERIHLIEHRLMSCRSRFAQKQLTAIAEDPYRELIRQRSLEVIQSEIEWLTDQLAREHQGLPDIHSPQSSSNLEIGVAN